MDSELEGATEELLALWEAQDPDPVDVVEDYLASLLCMYRQPGMGLEEWRVLRVVVVDRADSLGAFEGEEV